MQLPSSSMPPMVSTAWSARSVRIWSTVSGPSSSCPSPTIAAAEQVDVALVRRVPQLGGNRDRVGDDRETPNLSKRLGEEGRGAAGVDQQAVAGLEQRRRGGGDGHLLGPRGFAAVVEGALARRLEVDRAAVHLADPALLGKQRQVAAHGLARDVRAARPARRRSRGSPAARWRRCARAVRPASIGCSFAQLPCLYGQVMTGI